MLKTGTTIGGYRVERTLGAGGMGIVYEATQLSLARTVALKVIAPQLSADSGFRERFRREAMLQAALEHPHVVTVYEAGEDEGSLFLAMRLVRGPSLKQLVLDGGLDPGRALGLLDQVASALDAAHEAGLIHRDVKPQNMLVDEHEHAYLADFGLIKSSAHRALTGTGQYLGSLDYVSPEQIRGEPVSALTDLYAFAAVLYECVSGEVPYPCDTEAALLYAHLSEPPPRVSERAGVPGTLDAVVARGLAKRPTDRYQRASQLVADARAALEGEALSPPTTRSVEHVHAANGRSRAAFGQTITDPSLLGPRPPIALEPERRLSKRLLAALLAGVAALAAAGFLLGHAREKVDDPALAPAVAGPLALEFPSRDWVPARTVPRLAGLTLTNPVALTSRHRDSPGELLAGTALEAEGPLLLPTRFRAELSGLPRGVPVRLGSHAALAYRGLRHRGTSGALTVFVAPTDRGTATIACLADEGGAEALRRCEQVAATLALRGAQGRSLAPDRRYSREVRRVLDRLEARRSHQRRLLAAARTPAGQAAVAGRLAAAYRAAAESLAKLRPGPVERPGHRALLGGLDRALRAYRALARSAQSGSTRGFRAASARVRRAEAAVDRAARSTAA